MVLVWPAQTCQTGGMNGNPSPLSRLLRALPRALGWGVMGALLVPIVAAFGALGISHLAGGCGPGSSGGCEMGAAALGIYAILPGFALGAGLGLWRALRG